MPRTRKKNATPRRPTKSGVRGRGTYTGRRGAGRGNGGGGGGEGVLAGETGAASVPALVKEAPQCRQERACSLVIPPHGAQSIERTRGRLAKRGVFSFG